MQQSRGPITLVGVAIGDFLIRAGQLCRRRFAAVPEDQVDQAGPWWLAERWRLAVLAFCLHGDPLAFSQRRMERAGICKRRAWQRYTDLLAAGGVMVKVDRGGCYWAAGWNRHKLGVMLRRRMLSLPYPVDREPPPLFDRPAKRILSTQKGPVHSETPQLSQAASWAHTVPAPGELVKRGGAFPGK